MIPPVSCTPELIEAGAKHADLYERVANRPIDVTDQVQSQALIAAAETVAEIPANHLRDILVKVEVAEREGCQTKDPVVNRVLKSIFSDIRRLAKQEPFALLVGTVVIYGQSLWAYGVTCVGLSVS